MATSLATSTSQHVLERMHIEEFSHSYTIDGTIARASIDCAHCPYYNYNHLALVSCVHPPPDSVS